MRAVISGFWACTLAVCGLAACGDEFAEGSGASGGAGGLPSGTPGAGANGGSGGAGGGGSGGAIDCPDSQVDCGGNCVDTDSDLGHCGECDASCDGGNATYECVAGACVVADCAAGFDDCDDDPANGCEADLASGSATCGGCNQPCTAACVESECRNAVQVSAGHLHSCAVLEGGSVWCWGSNADGQLGDGTTNDADVPRQVTSLPAAAISVHAGGYDSPTAGEHSHTCALLLGGVVYCWGNNDHGQLGTGDTSSSATPVELPDIDGVTKLAVGGMHNCLLAGQGAMTCWGFNASLQVGCGTEACLTAPTPGGSGTLDVAVGWENTCIISGGSVIRCQGEGSFGQNGSPGDDRATLLPVGTIGSGFEVAIGGRHACARTSDGTWCWGTNEFGQVGDPNVLGIAPEPTLIGSGATSIETGGDHSAAIVSGTLRVWGRGDSGQLGTGAAANQALPVDTGLTGLSSLTLGTQHSCAILDGNVTCWGSNDSGQLGTGSPASELAPADVAWP